MTYKELLEKNIRTKAEREMLKAMKAVTKAEVKPALIVEETPHVVEYVEPAVEAAESEKEVQEEVAITIEEAPVEEAPKKKRKSSKPKNREYMVVENIEEVNQEPQEEEKIDF